MHSIRLALQRLPPGAAEQASLDGLDGMRALVEATLGAQVWMRALHNAPDEWEEDQMVDAMTSALCAPSHSRTLWLLAVPSKYERALLSAFETARIASK